MNIETTLEERGNRYGSFERHAAIAQELQQVMQRENGWLLLASDQKQALTVIADKIARMLNGDPSYRDNWSTTACSVTSKGAPQVEVKITVLNAKDLPKHIDGMNKDMRTWTSRAARGECAWICSDCCMSEASGMPDQCFHGDQRCTEIIQRDKREAMREGNEPS